MYAVLCAIVLSGGFLCLALSFSRYGKWSEHKIVLAVIRGVGGMLCMIGGISIYAVLSGKIVLPLIK